MVNLERYRASKEEVMQTDRWEEVALRQSLCSATNFRKFRSTIRSDIITRTKGLTSQFPQATQLQLQGLDGAEVQHHYAGARYGQSASSKGMITVLQGIQPIVPVIGQDSRQSTLIWCDQNFYKRGRL